MNSATSYITKTPDESGVIHYTESEHKTWKTLINRQLSAIAGKACDEYIQGADTLQLPKERVPQLSEVNEVLLDTTGWRIAPVPALINFDRFFSLLADRQFPAATFIRTPEELDYLKEPDIFHEIFGHCPLLTNQSFADFTHHYGKLGLNATHKERVFLARLYWFTVEFGLMKTDQGLRIYGGGILSSPGETLHALSDTPEIRELDILQVLRTPYRIDTMQPLYYLINNLEDLYGLCELDIMSYVKEAIRLGLISDREAVQAITAC